MLLPVSAPFRLPRARLRSTFVGLRRHAAPSFGLRASSAAVVGLRRSEPASSLGPLPRRRPSPSPGPVPRPSSAPAPAPVPSSGVWIPLHRRVGKAGTLAALAGLVIAISAFILATCGFGWQAVVLTLYGLVVAAIGGALLHFKELHSREYLQRDRLEGRDPRAAAWPDPRPSLILPSPRKGDRRPLNAAMARGRLLSPKIVVFIVTFISYAYHSARKAMSGVKASMTADWLRNDTHHPLFHHESDAKTFLGTLDALFMAAYACALFFWGWLGDRLNPRNVIASGMLGSAVTLLAFGAFPVWFHLYSVSFYVVTYMLFGLVQACGWPSEVAIMAAWFGGTNRGFVMGLWAACQPVGNIFGSIITGIVLPYGYENTFAINSALIAIFSLAVLCVIDSRPSGEDADEIHHHEDGVPGTVHTESEGEPVSMLQTILLPGVLMYCMCNACLKLVNYAFFFWLPLYLTEAYRWEESRADQLAIFYDVGGIIGSVLGGYISDRMGCRSPLIVAMVTCSLGTLFLYSQTGPHLVLNALVMTAVGVTISGPYNLVVGSVFIDLGSQPALAGNNQAMSTVSGLIDGSGSVGSAFGQLLIPIIQQYFGWHAVFYLFIILNAMAVLCILQRAIFDVRAMRCRIRPEGASLLAGRVIDKRHKITGAFDIVRKRNVECIQKQRPTRRRSGHGRQDGERRRPGGGTDDGGTLD